MNVATQDGNKQAHQNPNDRGAGRVRAAVVLPKSELPLAGPSQPPATPEQAAAATAEVVRLAAMLAAAKAVQKAARPAKPPKPPFGVAVGRVSGKAYGFEKHGFETKDALLAFLSAEVEKDPASLRELCVHIHAK